MKTAAQIDIQEFIDRQSLRGYHYRIAALCSAYVLMDGFDTQTIGFVAPTLVQRRIAKPALGPVLSSGLFGRHARLGVEP
jgi:AAHS family 4-hydroxybenzoate transporter-like MFS transporter